MPLRIQPAIPGLATGGKGQTLAEAPRGGVRLGARNRREGRPCKGTKQPDPLGGAEGPRGVQETLRSLVPEGRGDPRGGLGADGHVLRLPRGALEVPENSQRGGEPARLRPAVHLGSEAVEEGRERHGPDLEAPDRGVQRFRRLNAPRLLRDVFDDVFDVERAARQRPDAIAIVYGAGKVTCRELDQDSNRLARLLRSLGAAPGIRVAFLLSKDRRACTALVAILKSGAAYMALDPRAPAPRLAAILAESAADLVLVSSGTAELARAAIDQSGLGPRRIQLDSVGESRAWDDEIDVTDLAGLSPDSVHFGVTDENLACIVYTSGSTGRPKGVMVRHRSVVDYVRWTVQHFGVTHEDRSSSHGGLHFDLSVFDVFSAFSAGASLHPVPRLCSLFPSRLVDFV